MTPVLQEGRLELDPLPCHLLTDVLPSCVETLKGPGCGPHIRDLSAGRQPAACAFPPPSDMGWALLTYPSPLPHSLASASPDLSVQVMAGCVLPHTADQAIEENPVSAGRQGTVPSDGWHGQVIPS